MPYSLHKWLHETSPRLAKEFDLVRAATSEIWKEQHLRRFTEHGSAHQEQVEKNLDALTKPLLHAPKPLTPEEAYVLLCACYLHDIGMQLELPDARQEHAQYSYELILHSQDSSGRELHVELPIHDDNAREAIARVSRGHWTTYALQLPASDFIHKNLSGRLRFLGLLLALADLLDISPVRARYFRSPHRLYKLEPLSELHQRLHQRVRGFVIAPPHPEIPAELQFCLSWRGDSNEVRDMSDWTLHWFTNQWRQLAMPLARDSHSAIRWVTPWAKAIFHPFSGPTYPLSKQASAILRAERAEQLRIDRQQFADRFLEALKGEEVVLFLLPDHPGGDLQHVFEWASTTAVKLRSAKTARFDLDSTVRPIDFEIALLFWEQLFPGDSPPSLSGLPFQMLRQRLLSEEEPVVTMITSPDYPEATMDPIIQSVLAPATEENSAARICLLGTPTAEGPVHLDGVTIIRPAWSNIGSAEIKRHLCESWGLPTEDGEAYAREACDLEFDQNPGLLYRFIEGRGRVWVDEEGDS